MTFDVTNPGNIPIRDVEVTDDRGLVITFTGGDTDGDDELDPSETWTYRADVGPAIPGRFDSVGTAPASTSSRTHSPTTTRRSYSPNPRRRTPRPPRPHRQTSTTTTPPVPTRTRWHAASHGESSVRHHRRRRDDAAPRRHGDCRRQASPYASLTRPCPGTTADPHGGGAESRRDRGKSGARRPTIDLTPSSSPGDDRPGCDPVFVGGERRRPRRRRPRGLDGGRRARRLPLVGPIRPACE